MVHDRWVLSGILFINRNGLRWRGAPSDYCVRKTLYNRAERCSKMGLFTRIMEGLAAAGAEPETVTIDATYLQARRMALSLQVAKALWVA